MKMTPHPVITPPTEHDVRNIALDLRKKEDEVLSALLRHREQLIQREKDDPFRFGYRPPIWHICDALLGFDCDDQGFLDQVKLRLGLDWEQFSQLVREKLGFQNQVRMLLILGGNRSGKSEYSAWRAMREANKANQNIYAYHMSEARSINEQQALFQKYLPKEWKKQCATSDAYLKWKRKTGFSGKGFIAPNGSRVVFNNYSQDKDTVLQGIEANLVTPDEVIPQEWLFELLLRLASRNGKGIVTFTPIAGYSPSVRFFCDGGRVTRESIAFMLPRDGGKPDEGLALGLVGEEYYTLQKDLEKGRCSFVPYSRPEDVIAWFEERPTETTSLGTYKATHDTDGVKRPFMKGCSQPHIYGNRQFETVPRVMVSNNRDLGVVWFHCSDNPYGGPRNVVQAASRKGRQDVKIRVYGKAEKSSGSKFPSFRREIHVVKHELIPTTGGTNYMFIDPAGDRNFFMTWIRACKGPRNYVFREWPSRYWIPNVGIPEPWAEVSGRNGGRNDGDKGQGQESFGFGLYRYKFEIARLEKWADFVKWQIDNKYTDAMIEEGSAYPSDSDLHEWDETNGSEEPIAVRVVDSRAATTPRIENDRPVTLLTELEDIGLPCQLANAQDVAEGTVLIENALDYERGRDIDFTNAPKLYYSDRCENTIFAMENWMGVDGQRGACKDPIDTQRWFFKGDFGYEDDVPIRPQGERSQYQGRGSMQIIQDPKTGATRFVTSMSRIIRGRR